MTAQAIGESPAEFVAPSPHCLIGDDNAPLSQKQFDVTQAEAEQVIPPHSLANDCGPEAWVLRHRTAWHIRRSVAASRRTSWHPHQPYVQSAYPQETAQGHRGRYANRQPPLK